MLQKSLERLTGVHSSSTFIWPAGGETTQPTLRPLLLWVCVRVWVCVWECGGVWSLPANMFPFSQNQCQSWPTDSEVDAFASLVVKCSMFLFQPCERNKVRQMTGGEKASGCCLLLLQPWIIMRRLFSGAKHVISHDLQKKNQESWGVMLKWIFHQFFFIFDLLLV